MELQGTHALGERALNSCIDTHQDHWYSVLSDVRSDVFSFTEERVDTEDHWNVINSDSTSVILREGVFMFEQAHALGKTTSFFLYKLQAYAKKLNMLCYL